MSATPYVARVVRGRAVRGVLRAIVACPYCGGQHEHLVRAGRLPGEAVAPCGRQFDLLTYRIVDPDQVLVVRERGAR